MERILVFSDTKKTGRGVLIKAMIPFLVLATLSILVFWPTFSNNFQFDWDDTWQVIENPLIHDYSLTSIYTHFAQFWQGQYSPVNSIFYLGIYWVFGLDAGAYHAACLLLHVLSTYLVFSISRSVFSTVLFPTIHESQVIYAFFVALIFAIHPVQVESAAWISASKILLYGFFTLLGLWIYIKYLQSLDLVWLFMAGFAYVLALASKEQAIIFPLNLVLLDWIWSRSDSRKSNTLSFRVIWEKVPFLILAIAFLYFTGTNNPTSIVSSQTYPISQRLVFTAYSLVEYVFRFLAPVKLYFFYPYPINLGEILPTYFYAYFLIAGLIVYFVWEHTKKGNHMILFGFLFFLINLLLALHIISLPRPVITADRYLYLSVIGLSWILVGMLDDFSRNRTKINTLLLLAGGLIWLVLLCIQSHLRTKEWKDSGTTKSNVLELMKKNSDALEAEPLFNLIEP